jgi:hypothetical protein
MVAKFIFARRHQCRPTALVILQNVFSVWRATPVGHHLATCQISQQRRTRELITLTSRSVVRIKALRSNHQGMPLDNDGVKSDHSNIVEFLGSPMQIQNLFAARRTPEQTVATA